MAAADNELVELEKRFWQSMVDADTEAALDLLAEPALMVSAHGAMKFDHAGYRKMAEKGTMIVTSFELHDVEVVHPSDSTAILLYRVTQSVAPRGGGKETTEDMNDTSTWVKSAGKWQCVMHTETPVAPAAPSGRSGA